MSSQINKGTRVIINIERRTLKIILWLNLFLFIGFFVLGFIIGRITASDTIKVVDESDIVKIDKTPVSKKTTLTKPISKPSKQSKKTTISKKTNNKKGEKKDKRLKYPSKIVVQEKPSKKSTKKKESGKYTKGKKTFTIQVISLKDAAEAKKIMETLKRLGCDARVSEKKLSTGIWYRVRIGNYITKEIAYKDGKKLEDKGIINSFWISEND